MTSGEAEKPNQSREDRTSIRMPLILPAQAGPADPTQRPSLRPPHADHQLTQKGDLGMAPCRTKAPSAGLSISGLIQHAKSATGCEIHCSCVQTLGGIRVRGMVPSTSRQPRVLLGRVTRDHQPFKGGDGGDGNKRSLKTRRGTLSCSR